ncbi:tripartite tricarboxylate transporter TctB family protein [Pelagibacterium xiamenense]|uniref:tripartite tricarboxylate transporter TctB family protein n=1 Tax=Pelagibacterium xiamenense TaxID=2901140 RepID=UPI001E4CDEF0|nr:tripartite tricarboxylate transporter TctB family protein [Pelagibacterium xiamenense]
MGAWTQVSIDFETSHLYFPTLIGALLVVLGLAILLRDRARIAGAGRYWRDVFAAMDKLRFFGTIVLTVLYFILMVPIGRIWPNTGMGFLLCSGPYVLLTGLLFMHERPWRQVAALTAIAIAGPAFVWWLFTGPFFLTLP